MFPRITVCRVSGWYPLVLPWDPGAEAWREGDKLTGPGKDLSVTCAGGFELTAGDTGGSSSLILLGGGGVDGVAC